MDWALVNSTSPNRPKKLSISAALSAALLGSALCSGCVTPNRNLDATQAVKEGGAGTPVLSTFWRKPISEVSRDPSPQEFASPALYMASSWAEDQLFMGSRSGWFYALDAPRGEVLWKEKIGAVSSRPLIHRGRIYVGTDDGLMICLNTLGEEQWRYATSSAILQTPVIADDALIVSNEGDRLLSLDLQTGKLRWNYEADSDEEFTLRGHAGLTVEGEFVYSGFSDGSVVALRTATGSVAWISSLKNGEERFLDVDTTPVIAGDLVIAASSAGGLFALDKASGRIQWSRDVSGGGGLVADEKRIYFVAAELGVYALDFSGNIIWRQGLRDGGEPSQPVLHDGYLYYTLSEAGLFVSDARTGDVVQYFDPGYGISSSPTVGRQSMYVLSNSAVLYSLGVADI